MAPTDEVAPSDRPLTLEELPIISVITRRWSGVRPQQPAQDSPLDLSELPEQLNSLAADPGQSAAATTADNLPYPSADDETDEMDALPESLPDKPEQP